MRSDTAVLEEDTEVDTSDRVPLIGYVPPQDQVNVKTSASQPGKVGAAASTFQNRIGSSIYPIDFDGRLSET